MAFQQEIERKFLVVGDGWRGRVPGVLYRQGYIARTHDRVVRIRVAGDKGFLTVKIRSRAGLARAEFEYPVPLEEAQAMLNSLAPGEIIEKWRYTFPEGEDVWEIDEFLGANQGLVIAEIELKSEDQPFARPDWLGEEVSRVSRYLNMELARAPYSTWPEHPRRDTGSS